MGKDQKGKELGKGLSQRADGRYMARTTVNGEKILLYSRNLAKLKKDFSEKKKIALMSECDRIYEETRYMTLNEWFDKWLETKEFVLKASTKSVYRSIYNKHIKDELGKMYIRDIRQLDVQNFINRLLKNEKVCKSIPNKVFGVLKICLDDAEVNCYIEKNVCNKIYIPEYEKKKRTSLTVDEQRIFLEYLKKEHHWYEEMFKLMLLTGVRVGEMSALVWENINFSEKYISVKQSIWCGNNGKGYEKVIQKPKTKNSIRKIPFFGETEDVLKSQYKKYERVKTDFKDMGKSIVDNVFITKKGNIVVDSIVYRALQTIEKRMNKQGNNIQHIHPHMLRHTFATRCFERNMSPKLIQEIMGHESYDTTLIYTHMMKEKIDEEIQKIGNFLEE